MAKAVLFDLDGTLLPMDFDAFMRSYFLRLSTFASRQGFNPIKFMNAIKGGVEALYRDCDGVRNNRQVFWDAFYKTLGNTKRDYEPICLKFYETSFCEIGKAIRSNPFADASLRELQEKGYRLILATNPVFPRVATLERCRWAQIDPERFEIITTYEDYHHVKPDLDYYREILDAAGLDGTDCIMVGNNIDEDMIASELGMGTFLVTPYLLNPSNKDVALYRRGTLSDLSMYARKCPVADK